jgi:hypothetical protein
MAKDAIHEAVKKAITDDGWKILADPFRMDYGSYRLFADLAAERTLAAERDGRKIIVEIKTFSERSFIKAFQQALGQYKLYLDVLALTNRDYELYLAISRSVYEEFFVQDAIVQLVQRNQLKLIVVELAKKAIVKWIN